jgi:acyl dehydratase
MDGTARPRADSMLENRTFDEIAIGDSASLTKTIRREDIELFAVITGDVNPAHLDPAFAERDTFHGIVAHDILGAGVISAILGTKLPGPGTIYLGQDLRFVRPVRIGDTITASVTVVEKHEEHGNLVLDCRCRTQDGQEVITGHAHVKAPTEKIRLPRTELPEVRVSRHERFRAVLTAAAAGGPLATAIAHPCDANGLGAAVEAAHAGLITPIQVGPAAKIRAAAAAAQVDIHPIV